MWRSGFYPMAFATILPKQKKTTAKAAAKCTRFSFCYVYPYLHNRYQRTPTHIRTVVVLTLLVAMDLYLFLFLFVFVFVCFLLQFFLLLTLSWTMLVFTGRNSLSVYNLHSFCFHKHYFFLIRLLCFTKCGRKIKTEIGKSFWKEDNIRIYVCNFTSGFPSAFHSSTFCKRIRKVNGVFFRVRMATTHTDMYSFLLLSSIKEWYNQFYL